MSLKTAVFITVRMKSTRLPYKVMKMLCDKALIEHLIERLKLARLPDAIVLCTSTNPQDDILIDVAKRNGINWFSGDEEDVLNRLLSAAEKEKVDFIVSTTGDNPFTDPEYIDKVIELFQRTDADFIKINGLPFGVFSYGVKVKALNKVCQLKRTRDTEIWGKYFTDSGLFHIETLEVKEMELRHPEIRLTVDTEDDFKLVEEIFRRLYHPGKIIPLREVIKLIEQNPQLLSVNSRVVQRPAPNHIINDAVNLKDRLE